MDSTKQRFLSLVIPVFNGQDYVCEAIDSALAQEWPHIEVLVIDDGSTDATAHLLRTSYENDARVRLLAHPGGENCGVSASRNLGVRQAAGTYIAFLDADDRFAPRKITVQLELLRQHPQAVLCHGQVACVHEPAPRSDYTDPFLLFEQTREYRYLDQPYALDRHRICASTVVVRAVAIKTLDFSVSQAFQYEDFALWVLLARDGSFIYCHEHLADYRIHPGSATAWVLRNRGLRHLYSYLELLFMIGARLGDQPVDRRIATMLRTRFLRTLVQLWRSYRGTRCRHAVYECSRVTGWWLNAQALTQALRTRLWPRKQIGKGSPS